MDPAFITPFIASVQNVFATMLQLQVRIGTPRLKIEHHPTYDVSAIIGMTGDVVGSVVMSFPEDVASRVVTLFAGAVVPPTSADFADAVGELVNMVSGGAKAQFPTRSVSISCPSVVLGKNHVVAGQTDSPVVVIPCTTECGDFALEVTIKRCGEPIAPTRDTTAAAHA